MELARIFNGKKFMWDGNDYPDRESASGTADKYRNDGFETEVLEEENKYFIFTRRLVKEVIVENQPLI